MNYSRWLKLVVVLIIIICSPFLYIIFYNYYVDPLWNFNHSNNFNQYQTPFNERQQKTNMITRDAFKYDALLMGTSRSTYINHYDFKDLKTFNYSASSMHINEYNEYIEYAKKRNGADFEVIFMEVFPNHLDFPQDYEEPYVYINIANENLYKFKSLFSFDTYNKAKINYMLSMNPNDIENRSYNRENVAIAKIVDADQGMKNISVQLEGITVSSEYNYNPEYRKLLQEIKDNNPNTKFILFSPPYLSDRFLKEFDGEIGYKIYLDWINDCINIFGDVNNFMYINSVTENELNYFDSHHFYPQVGTLIANKIMGYEDYTIPNDFGVLVNNENIDEHLKMIRSQLELN